MTRIPSNRGTPADARLSDLTPARRRLVELLDRVWFGRVEDLVVRGGEPSFDRPPRVTRTVKIVGKVDPPPPARPVAADPALGREQLDLLAELTRFGGGLVRRIEVGHGRPLFVEVYDDPRPAPAAQPAPRPPD